MKGIQYYFKYSDSELCYNIAYFINYMKEHCLEEIEVYKAVPEIIGGGVFWCIEHQFCGDGTKEYCGKNNCKQYEPRNKISGVCKNNRDILYQNGDKIKLKLNSNVQDTN